MMENGKFVTDVSGLRRVPTVTTSEAKIAEDAPRAIAYLKRAGASDLMEMLGLTRPVPKTPVEV